MVTHCKVCVVQFVLIDSQRKLHNVIYDGVQCVVFLLGLLTCRKGVCLLSHLHCRKLVNDG